MKNAESLAAVERERERERETHLYNVWVLLFNSLTHTQLYVNSKFSKTNEELVGFLYPKIMVKTRVYD